jgi:ABC-type transporter Mla subunit MlaD
MIHHPDIDELLSSVELQLHVVSEALVSADGPALQSAATALRDAAVHFSQALPQGATAVRPDAALQKRIKAVRQGFASCRENLARRSAGVDRLVASLLPPAPSELVTYGRAPGMAGGGAGRFGGSRFS